MDPKLYQTLYNTESTYWWFVGQRFLLKRILQAYYPTKKDLNLLEIGPGAGLNLTVLSEFGTANGIDISDDAIEFCRKRGFTVKKGNALEILFKDNTFDIVTELGVFYHKAVTDDIKAMKEAHRVLKPGGRFIMMDCALMSLYGKHDLAFDGIRRYNTSELKAKLVSAGFTVEKLSYYNTLLFPFIYLKRKLEKLSSAPQKSEVQESINPIINAILKALYKTELRGIKYVDYPFGVNILAVARKP